MTRLSGSVFSAPQHSTRVASPFGTVGGRRRRRGRGRRRRGGRGRRRGFVRQRRGRSPRSRLVRGRRVRRRLRTPRGVRRVPPALFVRGRPPPPTPRALTLPRR